MKLEIAGSFCATVNNRLGFSQFYYDLLKCSAVILLNTGNYSLQSPLLK